MTAKRPPRVARWILEHAIPTQSWSESLSGDLAEQCGQRSPAWYWRQVAGAFVVGWTKEIYRLRIAIVFALLCSFPAPLLWIHWARLGLYHRLFVWSVTLPWQLSFAFQQCMFLALNLLLVWSGYALYLVAAGMLFKSIQFRRALRGLFTITWVYVGTEILVAIIASFMIFPPINIKTASDVSLPLKNVLHIAF